MEESKDLIYYLKNFNRKERYFLLREALGNKEFKLGKEFRDKLTKKLNIQIPEDAFAAMDYHLDWIYASINLWNENIEIDKEYDNQILKLNSNQEDIDLIIAFKSENKFHIILLEAKGVTGWTNEQMESKAKRFNELFGEDGLKQKDVVPHFLMVSPIRSERMKIEYWTGWMQSNNEPNWMELDINSSFYKITRCDKNGKPDYNGGYFNIIYNKK